ANGRRPSDPAAAQARGQPRLNSTPFAPRARMIASHADGVRMKNAVAVQVLFLMLAPCARAQDLACAERDHACQDLAQAARELTSFISGRLAELARRPLPEERRAGIAASLQEAQEEWKRFRDAECRAR